MAALSKSSLSAGEAIRDILANDPEVSARVTKIYPVMVDSADLPYIVYRRVSLEATPVKGGRGADTVGVEVVCYTKDYGEGVELAEAVREALDAAAWADGSLEMRSCFLSDASEDWQGDAYAQGMTFTLKIQSKV